MECMQRAQKKERGAFLVCKSWSGKSAPRYAQFEGGRTGMQQTERVGEGLPGFQHPLKGAQAAPWNAKTKYVERIHRFTQICTVWFAGRVGTRYQCNILVYQMKLRVRVYWMTYRGPGFPICLLPTPSPLFRQQVVSLSQSSFVSPVELTDGEGGGGEHIIRLRESLVLYKSFNTV